MSSAALLYVFGYRPKPPIIGRPRRDLRGSVFGALRVLRKISNNAEGCTRWLCACECDRLTPVLRNNLTSGRTRSCGQCNGARWKWWQ